MLLTETRIKNANKAYQVHIAGLNLPIAFIAVYPHSVMIEVLDYNHIIFPKQTFTTIEECKAYLKHYISTKLPKFID